MPLKQATQIRREDSGCPGLSRARTEMRTLVGSVQKMQGS